ncbi:hypothetical protein ABES25_23325 [Bacillus gobiensis]|uniref:hypothetical protein n=1 Tax=Bacillus gobiensis TaxID=1441095 RepID=UPI003D1BB6CC
MKEELCIVDLSYAEFFNNKTFHVIFKLQNNEAIIGQLRRIIINDEICWTLLLLEEKYIKMKRYQKTLRRLSDQIFLMLCGVYLERIEIIHISNVMPA